MKKIRFYPKLFLNHFKKRPSRIVTWFSIFAIIFALVVTLINPNITNRAKAAPGIEINNNSITLREGTDASLRACHFDNNIRACDFYDTNNDGTREWVYYNHYMIDVDGYLMIRYYPENRPAGTYRDYGFEYVYYHKPGYSNRYKLTSSTDLIIEGSNTVVYMEGNKDRALKLNNLTVRDSAVLTQVPANKDGINVPYSTNTAWGVQLFGYYYLGPNRQVAFRLNNNGNTISSLAVSTGKFIRIPSPDSQWDSRYTIETNGKTYCTARDNDDFCQSAGNTVTFQNSGANGIFLATMLNINRPTDNKIIAYITQWETDLPGAINWATDDYITFSKKFVPMQISSDPAIDGTPDGTAGYDTYFPAINNSKIGMAYYIDSYGVLQNHKSMDSSTVNGFIYDAPRMFQDVSLNMENNLDLNRYGIDTGEKENWGGQNNLQNFYWVWEASNQSYSDMDVRKANPLSYSRFPEGEDYLRVPYASYVTSKMIADQVPGQPDAVRQSRINLELTGDLNISTGGQINVTGKGFPGGITDIKFDYSLPERNLQFSNVDDNPIRGAGYGGGLGTYGPDDGDTQFSCSGSYGGNGLTVFDGEAYNEVLRRTGNADSNKWSRDIYCGQTYSAGKEVLSAQELGSGGGYYRKRVSGGDDESIGGTGGGSIHIKAANIIIDNNASSGIYANGGNGLTAVQITCNFDNFGNILNCVGGMQSELIETKGILGQMGLSILEQSVGYVLSPAPSVGYSQTVQGTAGSGGSIWLETTNDFNNQGTIEARGAQGALRYRNGDKNDYYTYYGAFNSIMKCPNSAAFNTNNCRGPAAGGGRIAVLYGNDLTPNSAVRAWGGGVNSQAEQTNDQKDLTNPIGGEGSVVYLQAQQASVNVRSISIDKSVNLCKNGEDSCKAGATRDVDLGNATASDGAWMLVQIRLINNTGKDQNNISITDEKFATLAVPSTITAVTDTTNWFDNGSNVGWNNISIPTGANNQKTLEYYFQVKGN